MICRGKILLGGYAAIVVVLLIFKGCYAITSNDCTTSCGKIHNITYPFRLKTDPENCGSKDYELTCENNLTIAYLDSAKLYVESINYDNFTIRVVDATLQKDNCSSIPLQYFNYYYPYSHWSPYIDVYPKRLIFINCKDPVVSSPLYVDASSCINGSGYWYVITGGISVTELADSCRIEDMAMTSFPLEKVKDMSYGFEVSWLDGCCDNINENRCGLKDAKAVEYCTFLGNVEYERRDVLYNLFNPSYYRNGQIFISALSLLFQLSELPKGIRLHYAYYYVIGPEGR